jgi:hypothetical protein
MKGDRSKTKMKNLRAVNVPVIFAILFCAVGAASVRAEETLESLDDPAPTAAGESLESLDGTSAPNSGAATTSGDAEVALDLGSDYFNPYSFSRTSAWAFLPLASLMLVGLHLIRVPKRKSKHKIDQAKRFFRGISGENTQSSILSAEKVPDKGDRRGKS